LSLSELSFQPIPFTFNLELDHGRIFKGLGLMPEHMDGQIAASATPFISMP